MDTENTSSNLPKTSPHQRLRRRNWKGRNLYCDMLNKAKFRAKQKNLPFSLTKEDIVIPEKCPVLGIPLRREGGMPTDNSPSLDKVVPKLGYVKSNTIIMSHRANRLKSDGAKMEHLRIFLFMLWWDIKATWLRKAAKNGHETSSVLQLGLNLNP